MDNYQKILKAEELFLSKEYHGAKAILESLLEEDSENVFILNDLALIYAELGDVEKAVEYFERVLRIDPTFEKAFFNLLDLLILHGHLGLAAEVYLKYYDYVHSDEKRKYEERLGDIIYRLIKIKLKTEGTFDFGPPNGDEKALRVAFVCGPNSSFLIDLEIALSSRYHVKVFHFPDRVDFNQVQDALDWADVVWFEWAEPILAHASNRLRKTAAVICRVHRYEVYSDWFEKINWNFVDHLIVTSKYIYEVANKKINFEKYEYLKVSIIPSFVNFSKLEFIPKDKGFNIAYLGYLNHRKNPSLLIQCIKALVDIDPRYKLYIGGISQSCEIDEYVGNLIEKLNLQNNVVFCGWIEDVSEWLKDKHYLILPSIHEGNPYCVLEAAACGVRPLIHSFPGSEDLYPEKWVFSTVEEFVNKVVNYNQDIYLNREYVAKRFSLDNCIKDVIDVLEKVNFDYKQRLKKIRLPLKNKRKSVCIVTSEFLGIVKNGGIGTAYTELAELLAKNDWDVTVLFVGLSIDNNIWKWIDYYSKKNINIVPLSCFIQNTSFKGATTLRALSYEIYQWLKQHQNRFKIIHFHEWHGLAFYTVNAKSQNLAFQKNIIIVGVHGPHLWVLEYNHRFPLLNDYEIDFMERESVKNADCIWFVNNYMKEWVKSNWRINPKCSFVLQYPISISTMNKGIVSKTNTFSSYKKKLVFFGRLEKRKGLDIFCNALSALATHSNAEFVDKVLFLGKDTLWNRSGKLASDFIIEKSKQWPWDVDIISHFDRNEAITFLNNDDFIVVIPSKMDNSPYCVYECLALNKKFIASNVGGIPELISKDYHDKCLFDPDSDSLFYRLVDVIADNTFEPPKPSVDFRDICSKWLAIHDNLLNSGGNVLVKSKHNNPFISVCLVHHDRPHYLADAIDSLLKQSYKNFEVILVDDGSKHKDSLDFIEKIDGLFRKKRWKIILQQNKYLGAARNCAARYANGEYILFMDDDNYAKPYELEIFAKSAISTDADILTCVADQFYSFEDILKDRPVSRYLPLGNVVLANVITNLFGDANMFVKRSVFENLGGFKEVVKLSFEDWEFLTRASLHGYKITVIPEPLFWYRMHPSSMLHTNDKYLSHNFRLKPFLENINPELYNMMILTLNSVNND